MSVSVRVCIYISMHPVNTYTNKPFLLIKTVQTLESKLCGLLFFFYPTYFTLIKKNFFLSHLFYPFLNAIILTIMAWFPFWLIYC